MSSPGIETRQNRENHPGRSVEEGQVEGKSISIEEIILARTQLGKDQFKGHCEGARFLLRVAHTYTPIIGEAGTGDV